METEPEMMILTSSFLPLASLIFRVHDGQKRIGSTREPGARDWRAAPVARASMRARGLLPAALTGGGGVALTPINVCLGGRCRTPHPRCCLHVGRAWGALGAVLKSWVGQPQEDVGVARLLEVAVAHQLLAAELADARRQRGTSQVPFVAGDCLARRDATAHSIWVAPL